MDLIKVLLTVRFGRPLTPPWPWEMMDRRRVSFAPRRTREPMLARLQSQAVVAPARGWDQGRLRWIAVAAMIAALLSGGLLAATGFGSQASLFEIAFQDLAFAA